MTDTTGRRISDFETLFRRGLGRAVLLLGENDVRPYRGVIRDGCAHNIAYDRQWEDARPEYLCDVVLATGEPSYYVDFLHTLLTRPGGEDDGSEDWEQITQVAALLARAGPGARLRPVLYEGFARSLREGEFTGAEALVRMDGAVGLDFVAEQTRRRPLDADDLWQEDALLDLFLDIPGGGRGALAGARRRSPAVAALVARVREARRRREATRVPGRPRTRPPQDLDEWRAWLTDPEAAPFRIGRICWSRWGRAMDAPVAVALAEELLCEQDEGRLFRLLLAFRDRRFPLELGRLLALAQNGSTTGTSYLACRALGNVTNPAVRQLGERMIARGEWNVGARLFARNPVPGDTDLLRRLLEHGEQDDEDRHDLGLAVRDYLELNPDAPGAEGPLLALYENGPCSLCRYSVVKLLQERTPLPDWLRAECRFDCDMDLRSLVSEDVNPTG